MWSGSRLDFSNIVFTRRYHPPMRHTKCTCDTEPRDNVLAEYNYDKKHIRFFLPGWAKAYNTKETKTIIKNYIRVLDHETIHGIVFRILGSDRFTGSFNPEWPMEHGFDPEYTYDYKKAKKKRSIK